MITINYWFDTGILHVDTSDTQKVSIGKDVSGTNDGIHINDVNYWYTDGNFKVGDSPVGNFVSSSGEISTDKLEVGTVQVIYKFHLKIHQCHT